MKLVSKNGFRFATGMFWQMPDEGKRLINLSKLIKDTGHDMFCQIKSIKPTWGFCRKNDLNGYKKVASLGKFIIDSSQLSSTYNNLIICYKFKSQTEPGDDGNSLTEDLYGYVVLLNGTICPDEGEYVSGFAAIKESIIQKASQHEIEALYLPLDVSNRFFSIYEILTEAYDNDLLLIELIQNLTSSNIISLTELINVLPQEYKLILKKPFNQDGLLQLKKLIKHSTFEKVYKANRDKELKFIINNIYTTSFTSDYAYWNSPKFKTKYKQALILPLSHHSYKKIKLILASSLLIFSVYFTYSTFTEDNQLLTKPSITMPIVAEKAKAVLPQQLIKNCLNNKDRFFKDLDTWSFTSLKCSSLGATISFNSNIDTTLEKFAAMLDESKNITLNNKTGMWMEKYRVLPLVNESSLSKGISSNQILSNLQQFAIDLGFELKTTSIINSGRGMQVGKYKFTINSQLSPVFLYKHNIFNNVLLSEINMSFIPANGFYNWVIEGEF